MKNNGINTINYRIDKISCESINESIEENGSKSTVIIVQFESLYKL